MPKLNEKQSRQRFQELYYYKNLLYPTLKERSDKVRIKNKDLNIENKRLHKELKEKDKKMEKILLELEEVKEMLY